MVVRLIVRYSLESWVDSLVVLCLVEADYLVGVEFLVKTVTSGVPLSLVVLSSVKPDYFVGVECLMKTVSPP